ncbi:FMN-dependent dehydrogenase, includes L-lactate dehydrogenase and type II isopentenyl diphosphate isomerase [Desulfomicrobium norvegicum]|uniref:FMN-dependent dehydrogenase, includes L-lactate dehydrogenase and type II isopentenyl diphosphate isomerase n=1 Tax=Desulfomicrobium norvegicum (strain DSM 1741 / NCIMB 8310) TaxID=52561 RepID=A0A8G2C3Z5_DESNO|nr:alpha-hydroxy-acid oxidizing protein [Desulfomicrobium norvegicum]SFL88674.1 FMN-dependent dehydrogenase, includes L-lactate dehydrogenase and type II isopentenyl diphosphate isomerase [Desulfomicrobium norvegicum]
MKEVRKTARDLMTGYCRVCPVCNGKACAGEVPGMGGLGTGSAFMANVQALAKITFNMRLVHEITEPDTSTSILGMNLSMPVMAAPIGGISFNMGGKRTEEEYIKAIIDGSKQAGIIGCTGDGVPPVIHESGLAAITAAGGHGIPFIKPWEDAELYEKLAKAKDSGATIVGMDIDAAGLITLRKMGRPVSPKSVDTLREIIARTGVKFIIKGIMTPEDAALALQAGADAIVVSNHGGRVLDHTPGTAEVLPAIAEQMKGKLGIIVDGGIRAGADVLKMLALGADAVMVGRPFSIAAMGGLTEGVVAYSETLRTELIQAMVMTGTESVAKISPALLYGKA